MRFPSVVGDDLLRKKVSIPEDLSSRLSVLVVAFQQWQQGVVNSWVPFLESMVEQYSDLDYYELPTIREMNWFLKGMINSGMRAGIPSRDARRRTITLYIDKESFREQLEIPDESNIHLFLVTNDGEVLWSESGALSKEKVDSLEQAIREIDLSKKGSNIAQESSI